MDRNSSINTQVHAGSQLTPHRRRSSDHTEPLDSRGEERKRRRLSNVNTATAGTRPTLEQHRDNDIESIDLTEVEGSSALSKVLAKQREDAVKAQQSVEHEKGRSILNSYKCPVCMDTPEDATSTVCGHLFCHKCIIDTLKFSEEQRADSTTVKGPRGTCPVCRKPLARNDASGNKRNLVPLQLKLVTKKRNTAVPNSG
ncbi:SUMO-targeted ubiquitin ligase complex subunit slx8 [Aspergillus alliaceus]|uniref:SUMO-targeted ubiquitin ligase complex subunit slx8 n=1 Tax=Petromyces alliaceus TaxID=209559 RepID=A0A8H6ACS4_PETAA|nr:SUMO-targeted ubiquitin ligase complex subunit slx8 [Aspergillus burnettii]